MGSGGNPKKPIQSQIISSDKNARTRSRAHTSQLETQKYNRANYIIKMSEVEDPIKTYFHPTGKGSKFDKQQICAAWKLRPGND